jgi:hypothetical protein
MAYSITTDDYFSLSQPAKSEELKNRVIVRYSPLVLGSEEEVYRSDDPISLGAGEEITIEAAYSNDPCVTAVGSIENVTAGTFDIIAENYYSWGAIITIKNISATPGTCELVIDATPLTVEGKSFETAEDEDSIEENHIMEYQFPENHLIQNNTVAAMITTALIESYATPRNDVSVDWRGNPALELGDEIEPTVYEKNDTIVTDLFYIYKQKFNFDGTLQSQIEGRKIPDTVTTEGV